MKSTYSLVVLLVLTTLSLPAREYVERMAVKRGQKTVEDRVLPLACVTIGLDYAALPINELTLTNTDTKDTWVAKVGSLSAAHPHVLTAMHGEHRSFTMLVVHLNPGRYQLESVEFEGKGRTFFSFNLHSPKHYYFEVRPGCVNYVGSLMISAEWQAIFILPGGHTSFPTSVWIEPTATRDKQWATDVVPGMAPLPSAESELRIE